MKQTITGTVKRVTPHKNGGDWKKTEIHVHCQEPGSKYPDVFPVDFWSDMAEEAQGFQVGEEMEFVCFLGGRESKKDETRAFLSLKCIQYRHLSHPATDEQKAAAPPTPTNAPPAAGGVEFPWSNE